MWTNIDRLLPKKSGVYLVLRELNHVPTSRKFNAKTGLWESRDTILYWASLPEPPLGYDYPTWALEVQRMSEKPYKYTCNVCEGEHPCEFTIYLEAPENHPYPNKCPLDASAKWQSKEDDGKET